MKKFLRIMAILCVLCMGIGLVTACEVVKSTDEKYFSFTLNEGSNGYTVSASDEIMPETVVIPAKYNGLPVTGVEAEGFSGSNCYNIRHIVFKCEGNVAIGDHAFTGLGNLLSVDFRSASNLRIGTFAFEGCTSLEELKLPEKLTTLFIEEFAFKSARFTSLSFSAEWGVTIGRYALANCEELTSVSLTNLAGFDATAFSGCTALESIEAFEGKYSSKDGHLFDQTGETLIKYAPAGAATDYTVDCKRVEERAFEGCVNLTSVTISESVEYVGAYAFNNCSVLTVNCQADHSAFSADWYSGYNGTLNV